MFDPLIATELLETIKIYNLAFFYPLSFQSQSFLTRKRFAKYTNTKYRLENL
ncbi:hypothetical protein Hanom_Chr09g00766321 [Helianthus anomalus]